MAKVFDFSERRGATGLPPEEKNPHPVITITGGCIEQEVDEMEKHLIAADRGLYQKGGIVVPPGKIKIKNPDGSEPAFCVPRPVTEYNLTEFSTSSTAWHRKNKNGYCNPCNAPRDHVRALMQRAGRLTFPILSGIITSPPGLDAAPLHGVSAPQASTGKSYQQTLWSLIGTGQGPAFVNILDAEGELDKQITALLQKGVPSIAIGNCPRGYPLGSSLVNEMLTASFVERRIFGTTNSITCSTRIFVSASGNNLQMGADMYRRTIMERLDAEMENPENREFKSDPALLLKRHRPHYVGAALTLLRGYIAAGKPPQSIKPLNNFDEWSDLVRSCIV